MTATLVVQTAFLGDVVLTTPLLSVLAARGGPVDVVTTPAAAPLLASHPAVRAVIPYDKRGRDRGAAGLLRLAGELRRRRYARVYLPHRSWRSAGLALLAGVPERIGFADSPAALTYTRRVPRAPTGHESVRLLALAAEPGAPPPEAPIGLGLTAADREQAAAW
ncbi:MAG TPA: glycosyltransferase family 9 protein, partial [Gemmatimonadales bacterium]|nr:glycosyltransferase family 9 protein [Gemmatimonadales bacterium]